MLLRITATTRTLVLVLNRHRTTQVPYIDWVSISPTPDVVIASYADAGCDGCLLQLLVLTRAHHMHPDGRIKSFTTSLYPLLASGISPCIVSICARTCIVLVRLGTSTFLSQTRKSSGRRPVIGCRRRNPRHSEITCTDKYPLQRPFAPGSRPVPAPALASASGTEQLGEMRQCLEHL